MMDTRVWYMLGIITIIITWKTAARVYSFSFPLNQVGPLSLTEDKKFVSKWKTVYVAKPSSWCGVWGGRECG